MKRKLFTLSVFAIGLCGLALGVALGKPIKSASAQIVPMQATTQESAFAMLDGASMRLNADGHDGIRYTASLGESLDGYPQDATFYVMIMPKSTYTFYCKRGSGDFYQDLYDAYYDAKNNPTPYIARTKSLPFEAENSDVEKDGRLTAGEYYVQGTLSNIQYENVNNDWFGIAYYEYASDTGETKREYAEFTEDGSTENIVSLASETLNSGLYGQESEEEQKLEKYVNRAINQKRGVGENEKDKDNLSLISLPSEILIVNKADATLTFDNLPTNLPIEIEWATEANQTVVKKIENGKIICGDYGETTVRAKVLGKSYQCKIKCLKTLDLGDVPLNLEVNDGKVTTDKSPIVFDLGVEFEGVVTQIKIGEKTLSSADYVLEEGLLKIAKSNLWELYGEKRIAITLQRTYNGELVQEETLSGSATFITYQITAQNHVYKMRDAAHVLNGGGHFTLNENITMTQYYYGERNDKYNYRNADVVGTTEIPFSGTFDGRGYYIKSLDVQRYNDGLLGVCKGATVKNVAFLDGRDWVNEENEHHSNGFVFAYSQDVALENVYVEMAEQNYFVFDGSLKSCKNVLVEIKGGTKYLCGAIYDRVCEKTNTFQIGGSQDKRHKNPTVEHYASREFWNENKNNYNFTTWDTSFWTTDDYGLPIPKSVAGK